MPYQYKEYQERENNDMVQIGKEKQVLSRPQEDPGHCGTHDGNRLGQMIHDISGI